MKSHDLFEGFVLAGVGLLFIVAILCIAGGSDRNRLATPSPDAATFEN